MIHAVNKELTQNSLTKSVTDDMILTICVKGFDEEQNGSGNFSESCRLV